MMFLTMPPVTKMLLRRESGAYGEESEVLENENELVLNDHLYAMALSSDPYDGCSLSLDIGLIMGWAQLADPPLDWSVSSGFFVPAKEKVRIE